MAEAASWDDVSAPVANGWDAVSAPASQQDAGEAPAGGNSDILGSNGALHVATDKAANMMTFGLGDPAKALGALAANALKGNSGAYDQYLAEAQREGSQENQDHPIASGVGDVAGFMGGFGNAPKAVAKAIAPTLFGMAKQGASIGAPLGAVSSFANTPGDLEEKSISGGIGGTIGGIMGAATPYAISGVSKIAEPVTNLLRPFLKSGQEKVVGKILNEATEGRPIIPEQAPIQGINLTTGQATNDPGLLWMEKSLQQKNPASAIEQQTGNNQAILSAFGGVGNTRLAEDAPDALQAGVEAARDANQKIVRNSWKLAGIDNAVPLPTQPLKDDVAAHISSLAKAEQSALPKDVLGDIGNLSEKEPLNEIQGIRSKIDGYVRQAYRSGDNNQARILGSLSDVIAEHADNPSIAARSQATFDANQLSHNISGIKELAIEQPDLYKQFVALNEKVDHSNPGSYEQQLASSMRDDVLDRLTNNHRAARGLDQKQPELANNFRTSLGQSTGDLDTQQNAYQAARAETANFKKNFNEPAPIRNVLGVDKYGADKVPISAVPDQFIKSGKGGPEAFQSFMNAMRQAAPETQADTLDAARNYFAGKFLDKVSSVTQDQHGSPIVLANKISGFLDDYSHVVNSPLFTNGQRQLMKDISQSAKMANRTASFKPPGGGSPTYGYLEQGRFIDALLNGWQKAAFKGASAALGATVGSHAGPIGTLGGAVGGSELAGKLYSIPQEKTMLLLQQAMRDPKLAQALQMKANKFSEKAMNPEIYKYLSQASIKTGVGGQEFIGDQKQNE